MSAKKRDEAGADWRRPVTETERTELAARLPGGGGLCPECRYLRLLSSARSRFVRCWLAESDSSFPRYPVLPVLRCAGFGPAREE